MATVVGVWLDVDGVAKVVASMVEGGKVSEVEVGAAAEGVAEDPDRVAAQIPAAAPSTNAAITTSGTRRFHHGRLRRCVPRMATTLAEGAGRAADGWAGERN
jgi:hypothetical protein